jgi:hypothetical protein
MTRSQLFRMRSCPQLSGGRDPVSRASALRLSLAGVIALSMTHAPITLTPGSHDFGDITVYGMSPGFDFRISLPSSTAFGNSLTVKLTGPDMPDFVLNAANSINLGDPNSGCKLSPQGAVCTTNVDFRPRTLGPKLAQLLVSDAQGNQTYAVLKGKGIAAMCVYRVVPCNFAHLWGGVFTWTSVGTGPGSRETETVEVNVVAGNATCTGGATSSSQGKTRTGRIMGKALFAVELLKDPVYPWVYRITAACPSPNWPATEDEPETPSRPAELGHGEMSSENQPATSDRTMTLEKLFSILSRLEGSITYPSPDTDPLNGVTGSVTVSWNLTRS